MEVGGGGGGGAVQEFDGRVGVGQAGGVGAAGSLGLCSRVDRGAGRRDFKGLAVGVRGVLRVGGASRLVGLHTRYGAFSVLLTFESGRSMSTIRIEAPATGRTTKSGKLRLGLGSTLPSTKME